ncbi:Coenzyme F420 hydrogenase/dehydrogenase, beta subunit C-terminal domain [Fibrobacter sp. UWB7]|uniref:Coenzyme F420 hydrogenase/dehydrogenase, beta subunit C-terminal domain n=1 Tax=Fibrobacter sp. UWB7 TaxID=1896206 RepID=UPI00091FA264|nr:Coenzyme F420 hydrogenase/dehydrogenase, beta subunit C-terminal domain [Fibrobacter sp. UWB7]SHL93537.1 Coenzyme F420 hydrogenase/dehydrogenase, beta subunit N-term [Fibrobacter sp. UWB7]
MLKNSEYYIGFSKDADDRFKASSGGIGTTIMRYLLSQSEYGTGITFVFNANLCMYVPKMIYSEKEINVCGSVYQDIDLVRFVKDNLENIKDGIVLSCGPCQVNSIRAMLNRKGIKNFIISYCCSGQTTVQGTLCYYKFLGINKDDVVNMQYRGNGWPSGIQIWLKDGSVIKKDNWTEPWSTIHQSNIFKPKRCLFCKLDLGKQADINLADPWLEKYKQNEKIGATLCVLSSEHGKKVFNEMLAEKLIEAIPSNYDEYAIAEKPNVHKEIRIKSERLFKKRLAKLLEFKIYKKMASLCLFNMRLHIKLQNVIRLLSKQRSFMGFLMGIVKRIKNKFRNHYYKKRLGGGTNFSMGENIVMNNPQCVFLGDKVGVGANTYLGPVTSYMGVAYNPKIIIGDGTWVGKNCSLAAIDRVEIGKNVLFAGHVHITDHSHGYEDITKPMNVQRLTSKGPVIIEDDCWLGFSSEILSGVHIGKHCVVAARAVVTKDVPAYSIVAGNPARVIKKYDMESKKWVRV